MSSENDAGFWRARYNLLFQASLDLLPQVENQWGTPEVDDWCKLMYRLVKEERP